MFFCYSALLIESFLFASIFADSLLPGKIVDFAAVWGV
jgi:hypothetical protein